MPGETPVFFWLLFIKIYELGRYYNLILKFFQKKFDIYVGLSYHACYTIKALMRHVFQENVYREPLAGGKR